MVKYKYKINKKMKTLKEIIKEVESEGKSIGHFNISDSNQIWGIFKAARDKNAPVIIGTSEGEREFLGACQAQALVDSFREEFDYPIFLNSDHCYSIESFKTAVDAGYDAAIFDGAGANLSYEENIERTKEAMEYARSAERKILVEGELGYIGGSSSVLEEIPEGADITNETMTKPEEIKNFVESTGVDLMAPAVGNVHGLIKGGNPKIDIERIKELREAGGIPLVLHGGSGITDEEFKQAIEAGISIIHVNTEIRVAYREHIEKALEDNPKEIAPYRYLDKGQDAVRKVVKKKLEVFGW